MSSEQKFDARAWAGDVHTVVHQNCLLADLEGHTIGWAPEEAIPLIEDALKRAYDAGQAAPSTAQLREGVKSDILALCAYTLDRDGCCSGAQADKLAVEIENALLRAQPARALQPQVEELRALSASWRRWVASNMEGFADQALAVEHRADELDALIRKWLAPTENGQISGNSS